MDSQLDLHSGQARPRPIGRWTAPYPVTVIWSGDLTPPALRSRVIVPGGRENPLPYDVAKA
jgi:hypothetical protein